VAVHDVYWSCDALGYGVPVDCVCRTVAGVFVEESRSLGVGLEMTLFVLTLSDDVGWSIGLSTAVELSKSVFECCMRICAYNTENNNT
jgi:hypothetical protein